MTISMAIVTARPCSIECYWSVVKFNVAVIIGIASTVQVALFAIIMRTFRAIPITLCVVFFVVMISQTMSLTRRMVSMFPYVHTFMVYAIITTVIVWVVVVVATLMSAIMVIIKISRISSDIWWIHMCLYSTVPYLRSCTVWLRSDQEVMQSVSLDQWVGISIWVLSNNSTFNLAIVRQSIRLCKTISAQTIAILEYIINCGREFFTPAAAVASWYLKHKCLLGQFLALISPRCPCFSTSIVRWYNLKRCFIFTYLFKLCMSMVMVCLPIHPLLRNWGQL